MQIIGWLPCQQWSFHLVPHLSPHPIVWQGSSSSLYSLGLLGVCLLTQDLLWRVVFLCVCVCMCRMQRRHYTKAQKKNGKSLDLPLWDGWKCVCTSFSCIREHLLQDDRAPDQLITSNQGCQHQYTFSWQLRLLTLLRERRDISVLVFIITSCWFAQVAPYGFNAPLR